MFYREKHAVVHFYYTDMHVHMCTHTNTQKKHCVTMVTLTTICLWVVEFMGIYFVLVLLICIANFPLTNVHHLCNNSFVK